MLKMIDIINENERVKKTLDVLYKIRREMVCLGLGMMLSPFVNIAIKHFFDGKITLGKAETFTNIAFLGLYALLLGVLFYGYNLEKFELRKYTIKLFVLLISTIGVFALNVGFFKVLSFAVLLSLAIEVFYKNIVILIKFWNALKASTQVTIILPIISAILYAVFKIEVKF